MSQSPSDDLRDLLRSFMREKNLSVHSWAEKSGISEGALRNFLRGRSETLTHATLVALARGAGTTIGTILRELVAISGQEIFVLHEIRASTWVSHMFADHEARFKIELPVDPRYNNINRDGALVSDDSADLYYRAGSILVIADYRALNRGPAVGDKVLCVEHMASRPGEDPGSDYPDLERTSLREIVHEDGDYWLAFKSSSPKWRDNIRIPCRLSDLRPPDLNFNHGAGFLTLEGVVIASYRLE